MADLAAFLAARLDEDEAVAKTGSEPAWRSDGPYLGWVAGGIAAQFKWNTDAAHAARHDPARVLREVAAKRAILGRWRDLHPVADSLMQEQQHGVYAGDGEYTLGAYAALTETLRGLAAVYSDHPDYNPAWGPG